MGQHRVYLANTSIVGTEMIYQNGILLRAAAAGLHDQWFEYHIITAPATGRLCVAPSYQSDRIHKGISK